MATASASGPGQLRDAAAGAGEQVEHAELGEDDLVPVGPGADDAGEAAHAVGQGAGAGVDETGGELVPRGVAGEGRVGEAGADAVVEPALELDEAGNEALDAFVALAVEVGRRIGLGCSSAASSAGAVAAAAAGAASGRTWPSAHVRTPVGAVAAGTWPLTHITSRARACLHGCERLGHEQRHAGVDVVDHRVVRLAAGPAAATPQRLLVGPEHDPARRHGEGISGAEARRRRSDRHDLLHRPRHEPDTTEGVSGRASNAATPRGPDSPGRTGWR